MSFFCIHLYKEVRGSAMAMTYRREKIDSFIRRLKIRQSVILNQLHNGNFDSQREFLKGQLASIELVIEELSTEFK
ncbi:hypothetical protein ERIC2_c20630 [Paenibacillus larvae subsp. larvae DSM 25430]|uniref:Uncharacterized protein n=4 Tax=Paenibacillus larvae TaxID=1464 RepID=V9W7G5_9BACL|nr:hypothetical protein ERIC2_c20630 [Paenibacillus larvae subsp. larvae DSM 25430]